MQKYFFRKEDEINIFKDRKKLEFVNYQSARKEIVEFSLMEHDTKGNFLIKELMIEIANV